MTGTALTETLTTFFGWTTVLHLGFLTVTTLILMVFRDPLQPCTPACWG